MNVEVETYAPSKSRIYTGYTLTVLSILFLLMDACIKFTSSPQVAQTIAQLGFPMRLTKAIGVLALACTVLYAVPATAVLGSLLLTGYLGGAIALHLRVDNPLFTHILFPIYVALFIWGGIWLRDRRLQEVFPITARSGEPVSPRKFVVTGYILTTISALLVLLTAVVKFTFVLKPGSPPPIFPMHHIHLLGYIEIVCTVLYLFPATTFLGALLLTAYMGGATAVNLQSGEAVLPSLVPVLFSALAWA
ncbi:MAG TPA: DoxX family protein, partial [Edaphobacter sp.]|nr:DoxX family protein [Edaphobacter sp.]